MQFRNLLLLALISASAAPVCSEKSSSDQDVFGAEVDALFEDSSKRIDDIYNAVDEAIDKAFKGLTKRIEVKWPDGALPTRKKWVTYTSDLSTRVTADFSQGEMVVETVVQPGEDPQEALQRVVELGTDMASASASEMDKKDVLLQAIDDELKDAKVLDKTPAVTIKPPQITLASLLPTNATQALASITVKQVEKAVEAVETKASVEPVEPVEPVPNTLPSEQDIAKQTVEKNIDTDPEQKAIPVVTVEEQEGRTTLKVTYAFINQYQQQIIESYLSEIEAQAKKYDVPVSVLLAIMETESSFNPRAVSPIPAFGLMQLVPKTAGIDAHLFVHGEKKVVSADYLFNEQNNIELGSAYFHLLTHRYLKRIKDQKSRFYCAVASYNTGVGNVSRTFTGQKNIRRATAKINKMSSQEVYQFLLDNLPAEETRNYLKKIVTRMERYAEFDSKLANRT